MFIAVGPPSFTALAFIGMAQDVAETGIFSTYTTFNGVVNQTLIADVLAIIALVAALFLWTLAFVRWLPFLASTQATIATLLFKPFTLS
jgi:hypothetical protein